MSAQVAPYAPPKFRKPVPMTPPLTAFDPVYLQRKEELPERIFRLKSGRQLSYFTEGRVEDPAVVCFPSAGLGKAEFITREPIPGVYLVCIDDMGHGSSSQLEHPVVFSESVPEIAELLDELNVGKFYVCGHSRGGCHAMQCAAALLGRVLGCAVISSPCDINHASLSKQERKKVGGGAAMFNAKGCFGALTRFFMKNVYYYPDKSKDFGFTGHMAGGYSYYKGKATGGAPKCMEKDHFFVTKLLDSELNGANSKCALLYEMQGLFLPWSFDVAKIQCPCFLYHETDGEVPMVMAEQNKMLIAGSELIVWPQHGHCSIAMEFENIVVGLVEGKSVESRYDDQ